MPALPLTFGCHLPMFGPIATRGNVLAFARTMEALGYESLWASDHVVLPYSIKSKYPYNSSGQFPLPPTSAFLEPLTTLALVAGVTERARYRGEFFSFDEIGVVPQPPRKAIPIWVGGHTPRALRRVAELGDGWHAAFTPPDAFERDIARLRAECAKVNRQIDDLAVTLRVGLAFRDTPGGADRKPLQGTPDQIVADIRRYQDLGVGSFLLEARYRDLDDMVAIFERFAREIRPAVDTAPRRP